MPFTISISTDQVENLLRRARVVLTGNEMQEILRTVGHSVGIEAEASVSEYPRPSGKPLPLAYTRVVASLSPYYTPTGQLRTPGSTYRSKFKSEKQQRFVMASIRGAKGFKRIRIPYRRTGALGRSINYRIVGLSPYIVVVSIGTNLSYARYVIDEEKQSPYFAGVWTPLQTDMRKALPRMAIQAQKSAIKAINAALRK